MTSRRFAAFLAATPVLAIGLALPHQAYAHAARKQHFRVPAGSLAAALRRISITSGRSIVAPAALLTGKETAGLDGDFAVEDAVNTLLIASGLRARAVGRGFIIESAPANTPLEAGADIIVTGTKIGGARSASNVIEIGHDAMRSAGRTSIDDVIRTIPQNFSGGQNPGVSFNVPETSGSNIGGSSSVNLRGIGSDATLTLLDGHRLPYSAAFQSVDISAIPFGVVDRIEIVPDGASAIYGSDAVAGVVNVILRDDFSGLETSAKLGGATDGGYVLQQYGATAGVGWRSGHITLGYEYDGNSALSGSERSYATSRPGLILLPRLHQHDLALIGRQELAPGLTFSLDALLGRRATDSHYATNTAGDPAVSGYFIYMRVKSFSVAPSLDLTLGKGWALSLAGTYGDNRTTYTGGIKMGTAYTFRGAGYYTNQGSSGELSASGPLFALPGGAAKAAVGVGWRRSGFNRFTGNVLSDIHHVQNSYYAFGELNLPLLEPLTATAALRYEKYPGIGEVATPKLGAILSPSRDIDIKASWGKSFRAPTAYEQFQPELGYLATAAQLGGTGYPADALALLLQGGNADLRPERSTNWSIGVDLHPRVMEGFDANLSYFAIDYTDRIVTPIPFFDQSLADPLYAPYVTPNPSASEQAAFIAGVATFSNISGLTYDPAAVIAIVRDASVNAGRETVRGVDAQMSYKSRAGAGDAHVALDLSYIDSKQQISANQPVLQLAGIIFNPPHLKGRGEIGYTVGGLSVTGDITYLGPVRDTRAAIPVRVPGMTPVDLTMRYRTAEGGILGNTDVILGIQNLFNEAPGLLKPILVSDAPFDSTNYSPLGRVVSLSVTKKW